MSKANERLLVWAVAIAAMAVGIALPLRSGTAFADVLQAGSVSTFAEDSDSFTMSSVAGCVSVPTSSHRGGQDFRRPHGKQPM